jgi:mannose-6-phosphate isomerase-like protein (cupin superfamily)
MTKSSFEHLKTKNITRATIYPPFKNMIFHAQPEEDFQIRFTHVSVPFDGKEDAHAHDFAEIFIFVPCTEDLNAFDAETWLYLGDKGEKMIINETCAVYVPPGLMHCPIQHKRVVMPFFFVNCPTTGTYSAIVDGEKQQIPVKKKK